MRRIQRPQSLANYAHGIIYAAHPVCAAVALETLSIYAERAIVAQVKQVAPLLQNDLAALQNHPLIGEARGVGLVGAVRQRGLDLILGLVSAPLSRPGRLRHGVVVRALRDNVVVCPPLIIQPTEIEELLDGLRKALDNGFAHAREKAWL